MDTIKNSANYVSDKVQEATSGTSKEANKQVAKDSNAPLGTRFDAGKDAVSDKVDESSHGASASLNKEQAKH
ncbi:Glucose-repressible protein [Thelotrema lepadinum]|nr:Glucose-repressible protein [Thelotrema lepadinum]